VQLGEGLLNDRLRLFAVGEAAGVGRGALGEFEFLVAGFDEVM
jgi:hypothetical protein